MNIASTIGRIAAVVATVSALSALAAVAQAGTSRPSSMSEAAYRALTLRSEALNQQYGLAGDDRALLLRSQALNRTYHLGTYSRVGVGMSGAENRALMLRSEALNEKYGLGQEQTAAAAPELAAVAGGFSWTAFGAGAAAVAGLVLLLAGAIAAGRSGHRIPRPRISS